MPYSDEQPPPTNLCCADAGALVLAAMLAGEEPLPCPHHGGPMPAPMRPDRGRPIALNDDEALAAAIGMALNNKPSFPEGDNQ